MPVFGPRQTRSTVYGEGAFRFDVKAQKQLWTAQSCRSCVVSVLIVPICIGRTHVLH